MMHIRLTAVCTFTELLVALDRLANDLNGQNNSTPAALHGEPGISHTQLSFTGAFMPMMMAIRFMSSQVRKS